MEICLQAIIASDGIQQRSATREVRAEGLVQGQRHDAEESRLGLGDALLGAVHEGADGEVGSVLQIALDEELQAAKWMQRRCEPGWLQGFFSDADCEMAGQVNPKVS